MDIKKGGHQNALGIGQKEKATQGEVDKENQVTK